MYRNSGFVFGRVVGERPSCFEAVPKGAVERLGVIMPE